MRVTRLFGAIALAGLGLLVSGFVLVGHGWQTVRPVTPHALTNAIKNGSFENNPTAGVATYWQPFDNGQAHFGWYLEQWPQAVHSGKSSQLMEIFQAAAPDRVIAVYQTVNVAPNSNYRLTIHALMRSDAAKPDRNQGDFAMDWGVDYSGRGKYYRVEQWVNMPLTEQLRIGPNGPADDNQHLFFELITDTIFTGDSSQITLFIRGVKRYPTGTEVNFNVDDVSLIGPYPVAQPAAVVEPTEEVVELSASPAEEETLPGAGGVLPGGASAGVVALAGLVLAGLGLNAAIHLLTHSKTG